jgi:hypothetical protein
MPYISKADRDRLHAGLAATQPGELNYLITRAIVNYIGTKGLSYKTINEVIGVLECAKMELYRRVAVDYENEKIKTNGDVYTS